MYPSWKYVYRRKDGKVGRSRSFKRAVVDPHCAFVAPSLWRQSDAVIVKYLEKVQRVQSILEVITH